MKDARFIWGVPALDLPGEYDLEVTYSDLEQRFGLNIETVYIFDNLSDELAYYRRLLRCFEVWLQSAGCNLEGKFDLNRIVGFNSHSFSKLEHAYYWFKFHIEAYSMYCGQS